MKRLVIYFHYDPAGCIDTACRIAVQAVQKYGRIASRVGIIPVALKQTVSEAISLSAG